MNRKTTDTHDDDSINFGAEDPYQTEMDGYKYIKPDSRGKITGWVLIGIVFLLFIAIVVCCLGGTVVDQKNAEQVFTSIMDMCKTVALIIFGWWFRGASK